MFPLANEDVNDLVLKQALNIQYEEYISSKWAKFKFNAGTRNRRCSYVIDEFQPDRNGFNNLEKVTTIAINFIVNNSKAIHVRFYVR